jgi:hypothetical protein
MGAAVLRGDRRWLLDRDDNPWYPTMRLFWQAQPKAWGPVIEQVLQALATNRT